MIPAVPVPTVEKPLTPIDYIAVLDQCSSVADVADYAKRCPEHVRNDERFARGVARRLAAIKDKSLGRVPQEGLRVTTNLERAWMDAITQLGCIVCLLFEDAPGTPGAVHHLLTKGGRRRGHLDSVCLCDPGHHQKSPTLAKVSRHPNKALFERTYAPEETLLAKSRQIVEERFGLYVGVDIDAVHRKVAADA